MSSHYTGVMRRTLRKSSRPRSSRRARARREGRRPRVRLLLPSIPTLSVSSILYTACKSSS
jgi:hypothetical protein